MSSEPLISSFDSPCNRNAIQGIYTKVAPRLLQIPLLLEKDNTSKVLLDTTESPCLEKWHEVEDASALDLMKKPTEEKSSLKFHDSLADSRTDLTVSGDKLEPASVGNHNEDPDSWYPAHTNLRQQLKKAHKQAENFRSDFTRLNNERRAEQDELERLIDELRGQLHLNRNEPRNQEAACSTFLNSSQTTFEHLQNCINQLLEANSDQEKVIHQTRAKLDESENNVERLRAVFDRLTEVIVQGTDETKADSQILDGLEDPSGLVEHLDKTLKSLNKKNEIHVLKQQGLENQLKEVELKHQNELELMRKSHKEQLQQQQDLFHNELIHTVKQAEATNRKAQTLSKEATELKNNLETELNRKINEIKQLQQKLKLQVQDLPKQLPQNALDKAEQAAVRFRCERDSAISQQSVLRTKLDAAETYMSELEARCSQHLSMQHSLKRKLSEVRRQKARLQREVASCISVFGKVQKILLHQLQLPDLNSTVPAKKDAELRFLTEQVLYLVTQLKLKESRETNHTQNSDKLIKPDPAECLEEQEKNLSSHQTILDAQKADIDRITLERDYYIELLNEQTEELLSVKADYQRQLRETAKLARTKERLDELTQQIQLLTCAPLSARIAHSCCSDLSRKVTETKRERSNSIKSQEPLQSMESTNDDNVLPYRTCDLIDKHTSSLTSNTMPTNEIKKQTNYVTQHSYTSVQSAATANKMTNFSNKLQAAQRDLELAHKSVPTRSDTEPLEITVPDMHNSTASLPTQQLQTCKGAMDVQLLGTAEEKKSLHTNNQHMSALLMRMTEQNQQLIKELNEQTGSSTDTQTPFSTDHIARSQSESSAFENNPQELTSPHPEKVSRTSTIQPLHRWIRNKVENFKHDRYDEILKRTHPGGDWTDAGQFERDVTKPHPDDTTELGQSTTISMPWSSSRKQEHPTTGAPSCNKDKSDTYSQNIIHSTDTVLHHSKAASNSVPLITGPEVPPSTAGRNQNNDLDEMVFAKVNEYRRRLCFDSHRAWHATPTPTNSNSVQSPVPLDATQTPLPVSPIMKPWRTKLNTSSRDYYPCSAAYSTQVEPLNGGPFFKNLSGLSKHSTELAR